MTVKAPTGPDALAAERAFATAISLNYEIGNVPAAKVGLNTLSQADLGDIRSADTARLQYVFQPGPALDAEVTALARTVDAETNGIRSLSGGVSHITYTDVVISGTHANISGEVTAWSETSGHIGGQAVHFRPSGTDAVNMTLDKVLGVWKVSTMTSTRLSAS